MHLRRGSDQHTVSIFSCCCLKSYCANRQWLTATVHDRSMQAMGETRSSPPAHSRASAHFYLSVPHPDVQAGLRVHSGSVEYSAILQCEPREMIRAHNGLSFEFAF